GDWESSAARAAQLFRLKDTVASLYAWGLLPRSTLKDIVEALKKEVEEPSKMVILDPIAGTGLHSVLLRQAGLKVWCADSVDGGSTQTSGADRPLGHKLLEPVHEHRFCCSSSRSCRRGRGQCRSERCWKICGLDGTGEPRRIRLG
ncbi:Zdhhc20, partial [Symbiodinium pilosum]